MADDRHHHSGDPVVRNSVFINADLTKAEALTAYQRRCRRRELAAARRSADNRSADNRGPIYKISYDNLTIILLIMPKLRSTYDGRLIYKTSFEERKDFLRCNSLGGVAQW